VLDRIRDGGNGCGPQTLTLGDDDDFIAVQDYILDLAKIASITEVMIV